MPRPTPPRPIRPFRPVFLPTRREFCTILAGAALGATVSPVRAIGEAPGPAAPRIGKRIRPESFPATFAIVGDFGSGNFNEKGKRTNHPNPHALAIAQAIAAMAPAQRGAYIICVGDMSYIPLLNGPNPAYPCSSETALGTVSDLDEAVGQLYADYIQFPEGSTSEFADQGASTPQFFPCYGDHDWWHQPRTLVTGKPYYPLNDAAYPAGTVAPCSCNPCPGDGQPWYQWFDSAAGQSPWLRYFGNIGIGSSSGNSRFYDTVQGPVHFFALSSDPNETLNEVDGVPVLSNAYYAGSLPSGLTMGQDNLQNSLQGQWFTEAAAASTAPWKIVFTHYPPFVSSSQQIDGHPPATYMQWDYQEHGIDLVLAGHAHLYERLYINGCSYVVCGTGGTFESFAKFTKPPLEGSLVRFTGKYGYIGVQATATLLDLCYFTYNPALPNHVSVDDRIVFLKRGSADAAAIASAATIMITPPGAAIEASSGKTTWLRGALTGSGPLALTGAGTIVLRGSHPFSGGLTLAGARLHLKSPQPLPNTVALTLAGGALEATGIPQAFATPLILQADSSIRVTSSTRLAFASSADASWTGILTILGKPGPRSIRFGEDAAALTPAQLERIRFARYPDRTAALNPDGYLVTGSPG